MWLMKIKEHPWRSEAEYLDAQADYVAMLFRVKTPRATRQQINQLRTNIRGMLQKEHEKFKYYTNEFDKEVTAEDSTLKYRNKAELCDFVKTAGEVGMSTAETVRIITEAGTAGPDIDKLAESVEGVTLEATADDLLETEEY